jgi:4'-phosphopantetheinyl transferase EntD
MQEEIDIELAAALSSLARPGMLVGCRRIAVGDESALLPDEVAPLVSSVMKVRRQSGTVRIIARTLLKSLGVSGATLPRSSSGAPAWPEGIIGSLAHDDEMAVAAVMRSGFVRSLGVDVEPAMVLPPELIPLVTTIAERTRYPQSVIESRILFSIKEAVFKAFHPVYGLFLDFQDIEIDLEAGLASVCAGEAARISFISAPRVVSLAVL